MDPLTIKFDKTKMKHVITRSKSISQSQTLLVSTLPNLDVYKDAPEIDHLKINRQVDGEDIPEHLEVDKHSLRCFGSLKECCFAFISKCKNFRRKEVGPALDNLDPITPRTQHSLDFLRQLTESKSNKSVPVSQSEPLSAPQKSIRRAYKAAFDGLKYLQEANDIFKQLIILLTFTRYAEEPLTTSEINLTHGKTILGSYAWMSTYALQQLQFDPDVEINGYPAVELKEVIRTMENHVGQTVYMWEATVHTIETVELVHQKAEHVFTALLKSFPETKDTQLTTTRHIKVFRKHQRRSEELEKLKVYDPHKAAQTWARFSDAPLRILYKPGKTTPDTWTGFDMLKTLKKFSILKMLQTDMSEICTTILNQLHRIDSLLHNSKNNSKQISIVRCFEDGFDLVGQCLHKVPTSSWSHEDVKDFLEIDKIAMDSLDLLTLSTATVRTLLHEVRHIFHIVYETTRDLDYLECKVMNTYEEIVSHCKLDVGNWETGTLSLTVPSRKEKRKRSVYDVEETDLETRDAELRFERSVYQDILKELPIFCNKEQVALTLQDAEAVFTESSHNLLSTAKGRI